jgi:hypothetical protein
VHVFGTQQGVYRTWQVNDIWILDYQPTWTRETWVACSGAESTGARRFDYNNTQIYEGNILVLRAQEYFIDERIVNNVGQTVLRRLDGLEAPVVIRAIERDDGNQCPTPPRMHQFEAQFSYQWNGGFSLSGISWQDISALLGGGNDMLGTYVVSTFDQLESASMLHKHAADVEIWLTNQGFNRNDIPADQNPYNP